MKKRNYTLSLKINELPTVGQLSTLISIPINIKYFIISQKKKNMEEEEEAVIEEAKVHEGEEEDEHEEEKDDRPIDVKMAQQIFFQENVDGMLDHDLGVYITIQTLKGMKMNIPLFCQASDLLSLIEIEESSDEFLEDTFVKFFCECYKSLKENFVSEEEDVEDEDNEQFDLTKEFIQERLSDLQPVKGAVFQFTFTAFCVHQADIVKINALTEYEHLLHISLKGNLIHDITPLTQIPNLRELNVSENKIREIGQLKFPKLRVLNMSGNEIKYVQSIKAPKLKVLDLSQNLLFIIAPYAFQKCKKLEKLNLSNNQFKAFKEKVFTGLDSLIDLNVSSNQLTELAYAFDKNGMTIKRIDLSENPLQTVQGIENLHELVACDIHGTKIETPQDLQPMIELKNLKALLAYETPMMDLEDSRLELIFNIDTLEEIDEEPITYEERVQAKEMNEERLMMEAQQFQNLIYEQNQDEMLSEEDDDNEEYIEHIAE